MKNCSLLFIFTFLFLHHVNSQWLKTNGPIGCSINTIAIDTNTNYYYAGTNGGGLYISSDKGNNWSEVKGFPSFVNSITITGKNIICATDSGLYLSKNNGANWNIAGNPIQASYCSIVTSHKNMVAAVCQSNLYISNDSGKNWVQGSNGTSNNPYISLAINDSSIFVGTTNGLYESKISTSTGLLLNKGLPLSLLIHSLFADGNNIFAATSGNIYSLYVSTNNGIAWDSIGLINQFPNISGFAKNDSELFMCANENGGIYSSIDTGKTWTDVIDSMTEFTSISAYKGVILAGNFNNGINLSKDNGKSWMADNTGINNASVSILASVGNDILTGYPYGLFSSSDGQNWNILNDNPLRFKSILSVGSDFWAYSSNGVYTSKGNSNSWTNANQGFPYNTIIEMLTANGNTLYAVTANNEIYSTSTNDINWVKIFSLPISTPINAILSIANDFLVGTTNHGIYVSANNSSTLTSFNTGLSSNTLITTLAYDGSNIYAGTLGNGLFRTNLDLTAWTQINNGLANDLQINCMADNRNNMFVGTSNSVYVSINNGDHWVKTSMNGLDFPTAILMSDVNSIYAGTTGNGVWSLNNYLFTYPDTINIPATTSNLEKLYICSDTIYSLSNIPNWIKASSTNLAGGDSISFSFSPNTGVQRTGNINITNLGGPTRILTIIQASENPTDLNVKSNSEISIYPVPVIDVLNVNIPQPSEYTFIQLYNSNGTLVSNKEVTSPLTQLNMSQLSSGIYLVKILSSNQEVVTRKIVKIQ